MASDFISEMEDLEKELDNIRWGENSKRHIVNFADYLKYIDDGCGEVDGFLLLVERVAMLWQLIDCFGESFYVGFDSLMNRTPEAVEKHKREDEEERENIERAEIVLLFARLIKRYDDEGWADEIRAHFRCELKGLEGGLEEVEKRIKNPA